jgi:hypothetical protein
MESNDIKAQTRAMDIALAWDIILLVGERRLHVNSSFLKSGSATFEAMFGPNFEEGQNLSEEKPKEIFLPDDDADAMAVICLVLHNRNDMLPTSFPPQKIFHIAVAADKYNCVKRLGDCMAKWLNPGDTQIILDLARLSVASYIFNKAAEFEQLTFAMISCSAESFIPLGGEADFFDHIPAETFCRYWPKR